MTYPHIKRLSRHEVQRSTSDIRSTSPYRAVLAEMGAGFYDKLTNAESRKLEAAIHALSMHACALGIEHGANQVRADVHRTRAAAIDVEVKQALYWLADNFGNLETQ